MSGSREAQRNTIAVHMVTMRWIVNNEKVVATECDWLLFLDICELSMLIGWILASWRPDKMQQKLYSRPITVRPVLRTKELIATLMKPSSDLVCMECPVT